MSAVSRFEKQLVVAHNRIDGRRPQLDASIVEVAQTKGPMVVIDDGRTSGIIRRRPAKADEIVAAATTSTMAIPAIAMPAARRPLTNAEKLYAAAKLEATRRDAAALRTSKDRIVRTSSGHGMGGLPHRGSLHAGLRNMAAQFNAGGR